MTEQARAALPQRRTALLVEYDGSAYRGLQRQTHDPNTIQQRIEDAANQLGSPQPRFIASGRTDAGVHARGQVIALDLPERLEERRIPRALNALLPPDIRVRRACLCEPGFSPRLDARMRMYVYRLCAGEPVTPLFRHFVAHVTVELDPERTIAAARAFAGKWEMREWRSALCEAKRTHLTISEAEALPPDTGEASNREPLPYWRFRFRARSFLHHQVRFMVGGIVAVGTGKLKLEALQAALAAGTRPGLAKCEAACGLCLEQIDFAPGKDPFA